MLEDGGFMDWSLGIVETNAEGGRQILSVHKLLSLLAIFGDSSPEVQISCSVGADVGLANGLDVGSGVRLSSV